MTVPTEPPGTLGKADAANPRTVSAGEPNCAAMRRNPTLAQGLPAGGHSPTTYALAARHAGPTARRVGHEL